MPGGAVGGLKQQTRCNAIDAVHGVYNVYSMDSRDLIRLLEQAGWRLDRVRGSHHVFVHQARGGHLVVPHPRKDLGVGLAKKLLRQAGIDGGKP